MNGQFLPRGTSCTYPQEKRSSLRTNAGFMSQSQCESQDADIQMLIGNQPSVEANYVEDLLRSEGDTLVCCVSVDVDVDDDDEEEHFNESIFDRVEEDGTSASVAGSRQCTVKPKQLWSDQYCELEVSGECESIHTHLDPYKQEFTTKCFTLYSIQDLL